MKEPDLIQNVLSDFDKLIDEAPGIDEPQAEQSSAPHAISERHGWGKRYCENIELHGERWFAAMANAATVVASGGIVALIGGRGPGKTQMAAEIAKSGLFPIDHDERTIINGCRITSDRKTAIYRRAIDLFLELREAAQRDSKTSEKKVLDKLAAPGLLVIDEFQERGETEWENRIINNLIDKRYSAGRPTIIIANLTRTDLFAALGDSITDRARENGKSIEFDWPSFRKPRSQNAPA